MFTPLLLQKKLNELRVLFPEVTVGAEEVCGKCEVVCGEDIEGDKDDWFLASADRFYFFEAYNSYSRQFEDPPYHARTGGNKGKVKEQLHISITSKHFNCKKISEML